MSTIWFDFDGTITDVKTRYTQVFIDFFASKYHIDLNSDKYWQFRQAGLSTLKILENYGYERFIQEYIDFRNETIESIAYLKKDTLRANVEETLSELKKRFTLKILSGRAIKENLIEQINFLNLSSYFTEVYTVSPFAAFVEKQAVLKKNASISDYMVGDTEHDIKAGNSCSLKTIAISDGMSTKERLIQSLPTQIIDSFSKLSSIL